MTHENLTWQTRDGLKVHANLWRSDTEPKAVVCLVHGMGEHSGRYAHVAEYLTSQNISLLAFDHRGHGKTEGKRGHTPDYDHLLNDVEDAIKATEKAVPGHPVVLYGHSMGGNVVTNYLLRRQPKNVAGAIVTGPWFKLAFDPPGFLLALGRLMNKIWPSFTNKSDLKSEDLSRDTEVGKKYDADPLVHRKISARFFNSVSDAGEWALANGNKLSTSTLLMHGGADKITSAPASKQFGEGTPNNLTTYVEWEGMFHEIHNENGKEDVLERIGNFIQMILE